MRADIYRCMPLSNACQNESKQQPKECLTALYSIIHPPFHNAMIVLFVIQNIVLKSLRFERWKDDHFLSDIFSVMS